MTIGFLASVARAEEAAEGTNYAPYFIGAFALLVLVALLVMTLMLGKGRPHS